MICEAFLCGPFNDNGELKTIDGDIIRYSNAIMLHGKGAIKMNLDGDEEECGFLMDELFNHDTFAHEEPSDCTYDNIDADYQVFEGGEMFEEEITVWDNDKLLVFTYEDHDMYEDMAKVWFSLKWVISKKAYDVYMKWKALIAERHKKMEEIVRKTELEIEKNRNKSSDTVIQVEDDDEIPF